jgi:dehydrogenase/reductase SDR family member 4
MQTILRSISGDARLLVRTGANGLSTTVRRLRRSVHIRRRAADWCRCYHSPGAAAAGGKALGVEANVRDAAHLDTLVNKTVERFGRIDILVNNAGTNPVFGDILDLDERAWDTVMNTNLKAPWLLCRLVVKQMRAQGEGGSIVNVSSAGGTRYSRGLGSYSVSKAGLIMLTRVLAAELGKDKIRVNAFAPGLIKTEFSRALWENPEIREPALRQMPLARVADADETAGTVVFLASDASSYITGQTIVQDGGQSA